MKYFLHCKVIPKNSSYKFNFITKRELQLIYVLFLQEEKLNVFIHSVSAAKIITITI